MDNHQYDLTETGDWQQVEAKDEAKDKLIEAVVYEPHHTPVISSFRRSDSNKRALGRKKITFSTRTLKTIEDDEKP